MGVQLRASRDSFVHTTPRSRILCVACVISCTRMCAVMAGDRKTGESAAGDDNNNAPESESGAPNGRGTRALLAAGVGEHTDGLQEAVQPGGNAARLSLERDVHRFQVSRQGRSKRKKARRSDQSAGTKSTKETDLTTHAATHPQPTVGREPTEGDDTPSGVASDVTLGGAGLEDAALNDAETAEPQNDAKRARARKRSPPRKPSPNSVAMRLLLPVVEEAWDGEVAAFTARGSTPPPLPYRPTNYAEAFELTADLRRAIPKDQIRRLNAKATQCVVRALGAGPLLDEWRPRMASLPVNLERIDLIPTLARALSHADARLAMAFEVTGLHFIAPGETMVLTRREQLQRLLQLALDARARLLSEIRNLITLQRVAAGAVSNLKGGGGYSNVALDLLVLIELRRAAIAAGAHSNISEEDVERCSILAYGLIETDARTPNGGDAVRAAALEERARAFTLLWLAYSEAERAFAFIFWHHGKHRVVLPPLV